MNDEELSDWSAPGEKPPDVGVWETDYVFFGRRAYQFFNGCVFRFSGSTPDYAWKSRHLESYCDQSKVRFRGLVKKP